MKISISSKSPTIISGFPGIGKSWLKANSDLNVADSDSSKWDKSNFPQNYLAHISALYAEGNFDIILVSSHSDVRQGLVQLGLPFTLIYPNIKCKANYLERYVNRGSPQAFIDMMAKNWESFIEGCFDQENCNHVVLTQDKYLKDVLDQI